MKFINSHTCGPWPCLASCSCSILGGSTLILCWMLVRTGSGTAFSRTTKPNLRRESTPAARLAGSSCFCRSSPGVSVSVVIDHGPLTRVIPVLCGPTNTNYPDILFCRSIPLPQTMPHTRRKIILMNTSTTVAGQFFNTY